MTIRISSLKNSHFFNFFFVLLVLDVAAWSNSYIEHICFIYLLQNVCSLELTQLHNIVVLISQMLNIAYKNDIRNLSNEPRLFFNKVRLSALFVKFWIMCSYNAKSFTNGQIWSRAILLLFNFS